MSTVVVRLLEPEMCLDCRFAVFADVDYGDRTEVRTVYCRRGDCDNWDHNSAEPVRLVRIDNGERPNLN